MKRPFATAGAAALIFLAVAARFGAEFAEKAAPICMGLGFCTLFALIAAKIIDRKNGKLRAEKCPRAFSVLGGVVVGLLVGAVCLMRFSAASVPVQLVEVLNGEKVRLRGTVLDYPSEQYHKIYYKIKVERVTVGDEVLELPTFNARISTQVALDCEPYDTVDCTVKFFGFDSSGGLYSTRNSRLADGIAIGGYIADYSDIQVVPGLGASPRELLVRWRHILARSVEKRLPTREAGFIRGLLLGESERIDERDYADFKKIGASHILVISGLHMGALAMCFSVLFGAFRLRRSAANLLTAAAIVLFLAMIGFPPSAVRAAIMYIVVLLGGCLGRRADGVNSLGFAVLLICLENPFSGGDLGLTLSVLATLGILLFANGMARRLIHLAPKRGVVGKIMRAVVASVSVSLSAAVFTLPIQVAVFGGVSLLAPIASLVLVLPCTVLLYAALGAAFFGAVPLLSFLAEPAALCAGWLARFSLVAAERLARIPGTYLPLNNNVWLVVVIGWGILGVIMVFVRNRAEVCALLAVAVILFGCGRIAENSGEKITLATAEESSCVVMIKGRSAAVLSLGGYKTTAAEEILLKNNIEQVELLCMPMRDLDAREAAVGVLRSFSVKKIAVPTDAYIGRDLILAGRSAERIYMQEDDTIEVLDVVRITARKNMTRLEMEIYGVTVMVEVDDSGAGECQMLFTTQTDSDINSGFTVLQNSDIMEDITALPSGMYLLAGERGLYCDIHDDGSVSFRGESVCLR